MAEELPFIRHIAVQTFDEEVLREIFDEHGKLVGVIHKKMMTREEVEAFWPGSLDKIKE